MQRLECSVHIIRGGVAVVTSVVCDAPAKTLSNPSTGLRARCGELLETVTVQYTSDFGLVVRGLLTEEETGMSAAKRQRTCITID